MGDEKKTEENINLAAGEDDLDTAIEAGDKADADQAAADATAKEEAETKKAEDDAETAKKAEEEEAAEKAKKAAEDQDDPEAEATRKAEKEEAEAAAAAAAAADDDVDYKKRFKDTQEELRIQREKNADLRKTQLNEKMKEYDDFEPLDEEEEAQLKADDAEAYAGYLEDKINYERADNSFKEEREKIEADEQAEQVKAAQKTTLKNIAGMAGLVGMQINSPDELTAFIETNDPALTKMGEFLIDPENGFSRNEEGVYTTKQMKIAWDNVTNETSLASAGAEGYKKAVEQINASKGQGSNLSKIASDSKQPHRPKLSQAEIAAMGEVQADAALKSMKDDEN